MARKKKPTEEQTIPAAEDIASDTTDINSETPEIEEPNSDDTSADIVEVVDEHDDQSAEEAKEDEVAEDGAQVEEDPADVMTEPQTAPVGDPVRRGGAVQMVLGGALCAALGFVGAQFIKPEGWPFPGAGTRELSARIDALSSDLEESRAVTDSLARDLESARAALASQIEGAVAGIDLDSAVEPLSQQLADLGARMDAAEARPVAEAIVSPEATAAYEKQLAAMQALLESEIARLEAAQEAAVAQEAAASAATALAGLKTAVDSGDPFVDLLAEIEGELPAALTSAAETGVTGIAALQDRFPAAARAALTAAARASYEAGDQGWFSTFTRTQLGLRSLTPKEGDSADAVLSRAEADVREADFSGALSTLSTLPPAAKDAFADWMADAAQRVAVTDALAELSSN